MANTTSGGKPTRMAKRPTRSSTSSTLPEVSGGSVAPVPDSSKMISPDGVRQRKAKKMMMDSTQLSVLQNDLRIASVYINSRHLEMLSPGNNDSLHTSRVCAIDSIQKSRNGIAVYQITKLMYDKDENSFEKLVSVYSALNNFGGFVGLILKSDGSTVSIYLCTNVNGMGEVAGEILANNLRGHFPGCEVEKLTEKNKNQLLDSIVCNRSTSSTKTVRSISMIPSRREDERQHDKQFSAQGYEKFIEAMSGQVYTLVVLSQRVSPDAMEECIEGLEALYTCLSPYARETAAYGENESDTINYSISNNINSSVSRSISKSFGTSHTDSVSEGKNSSRGTGYGIFDIHFNSGSSKTNSSTSASGVSSNYSEGDSESNGSSSGDTQSTGTTDGRNFTMTLTRDNKSVQNLLIKIDDHIKRINGSQSFGMWNSACYVITDNISSAMIATGTLAALFAGDSQAMPRAYYNQWDATNILQRDYVLDYLQCLRHPVIELTIYKEESSGNGKTTKSIYSKEKITPAMMISGKEIPTLMGLPKKSVPGIVVDSMAEFGRNILESWKAKVKRPIKFGNIYHMGQMEKTQMILDLDTFASHTFICGATGSGKSNTTYNILQEMISYRIPFLVIEPAKGEYKKEFAGLPNINIFTVGESPYRRLLINPFEFGPGIHIREHLDNVIQVVSACWPLYGAMPGLLKQAFEQVYIDHGWDLEHSERIEARGSKFPVFSDLADVLERIINNSSYSAQAKSDYKGALLNRVSSLCNGIEGQIFSRSIGISDGTLFGKNTIIDLSNIGSDETRALVMGIMIIKLRNYRKTKASAPNSQLVHITVLEEAHNILKRCSKNTSVDAGNVQGAAVENLCRCIAEMRSFGEGFMIIDQSPTAVDESAIKNTAIKICMRIQTKSDCEEMGTALSLTDDQVRELSRLDVGVAAVFHAGWTDTVLAKMGSVWKSPYKSEVQKTPDAGIYTMVQGAIVQLVYKDIIEGSIGSVGDDVRDLIMDLCSGSSALTPTLPESKQSELLEEVLIFCENSEILIKEKQIKKLKTEFFGFVFSFLRLDSVMKIYELKGVNTKMTADPLSTKEIRAILNWERNLRHGVTRYLFMPEKCEPDRLYKWPAEAEKAEYFWQIYDGVLSWYSVKYKENYKYVNAMAHLHSMKSFAP